VVQLSSVAETTLQVAATPPKVTEVMPLRFVPVMVTGVPPISGPELGAMPEMVGAAM
jgi:hypothetical protein